MFLFLQQEVAVIKIQQEKHDTMTRGLQWSEPEKDREEEEDTRTQDWRRMSPIVRGNGAGS